MTTGTEVEAGTCIACGRDLVRTPERTYHPAEVLGPGDWCPSLIPVDSRYPELGFTGNVPSDQFVKGTTK